MIEVFHLDAKKPSRNKIFTRFVIVGGILSIHSFKSFVGRVSNLHDLVFILKMIFLTSVSLNGLNSASLDIFFPVGWYTGFSVRLSLILWILFIKNQQTHQPGLYHLCDLGEGYSMLCPLMCSPAYTIPLYLLYSLYTHAL